MGDEREPASETPMSGEQYEISGFGYRAVVAGVGATLRMLTFGDRNLVVPFEADELRPYYRGATLAPWPNRVLDGRYRWGGEDLQLSITEPKRGHALHGLASWLEFRRVEHTASRLVLTATVQPQAGYPHRISLTVTFELADTGLSWSVSGTNLGSRPAPFGAGPHPYLVAGPGLVDDWALEVPAAQVQTVTEDRLVPVDVVDVGADGGAFDFRARRNVGGTFLDNAYTGIARDAAGVATVRVIDPASGQGAGMRFGADSPWVQVHTGDLPEAPESSRIGLAVEPMTCPPGALNSGTDVIRLEAGETVSVSWELFAI
ncbi:aldose 1-epimerase family protein [Lysobacter korlensis]|uniref:Aldose 1-epimerase family protein n=1 Tax=Lysobacter korlensis TaxID=553636 RepID=A0ABV6RWJ5_9GAMM